MNRPNLHGPIRCRVLPRALLRYAKWTAMPTVPPSEGPIMAEMTIRLECDPVTGKKDIIVSLRSDEDALPQEHEQSTRSWSTA